MGHWTVTPDNNMARQDFYYPQLIDNAHKNCKNER